MTKLDAWLISQDATRLLAARIVKDRLQARIDGPGWFAPQWRDVPSELCDDETITALLPDGAIIWEAKVAVFREEARYCADKCAAGTADVKDAAHELHCSEARVRQLARVWRTVCEVFGEGEFVPIPLNVYEAAVDAPDPHHALKMAVDCEYRQVVLGEDDEQNIWSARRLKDYLGLNEGEQVSRVAFRGRGPVEVWDVGTGRFACSGLPLSGNSPAEAEVTIREVIDGSGTAKTNP